MTDTSNYLSMFIVGLLVGFIICGGLLIYSTQEFVKNIHIDSIVFSVNETKIINTFFTEMEKRGYNMSKLNITNEVNISGFD
jgi:hypothetical protein